MDWIRTDRRPTYAIAAAVVLCVLWWSFVGGARVPVLGFVDLAVHEAGHVVFMWAPRDVMLAMGNGFQALVPLVFAGAFVVRHRDLAGGAASLAWCAASLQDASVYVADAPYRRLPLLGPESTHDWWQLLGGHGWLGAADEVARVVWIVGLLVWLLAVAVLVVGVRWDQRWMAGRPGTLYLPWAWTPPAIAVEDLPPPPPPLGPPGAGDAWSLDGWRDTARWDGTAWHGVPAEVVAPAPVARGDGEEPAPDGHLPLPPPPPPRARDEATVRSHDAVHGERIAPTSD